MQTFHGNKGIISVIYIKHIYPYVILAPVASDAISNKFYASKLTFAAFVISLLDCVRLPWYLSLKDIDKFCFEIQVEYFPFVSVKFPVDCNHRLSEDCNKWRGWLMITSECRKAAFIAIIHYHYYHYCHVIIIIRCQNIGRITWNNMKYVFFAQSLETPYFGTSIRINIAW